MVPVEPPSKRGRRRRDAMLDAAERLFLAHGYDATSLDMIIAEAGGSRRSLYEYFGGKEGLFETVVERIGGEIFGLLDHLDVGDRPPHAALATLGLAFLRQHVDPKFVALYRLVLGESAAFPEVGRMFWERGPGPAYDKLEDYLRRLTADGQLSLEDPGISARQFVEMVTGAWRNQACLLPQSVPADDRLLVREVEIAVETFLSGCQSH